MKIRAFVQAFFTVAVLFLTVGNSFAEILRFRQVDATVFRGSQPTTAQDYDRLYEMGVRYVFNLRDDSNAIQWEKAELDKRGMVLVSYPMNPFDSPDPATVQQLIYQIAQAGQQAGVYVHCHHGKDRTGVIMALYRIHVLGEDRMVAYSEMVSLGFNHIFMDMLDFFWVYSVPGTLFPSAQ